MHVSEYKLFISPHAWRDIMEVVLYIEQNQSRKNAVLWKNAILQSIHSLSEMPYRCQLSYEVQELNAGIRTLLHHPFRILFRVIENRKTVHVLRIYHESREPLTLEDFKE